MNKINSKLNLIDANDIHCHNYIHETAQLQSKYLDCSQMHATHKQSHVSTAGTQDQLVNIHICTWLQLDEI